MGFDLKTFASNLFNRLTGRTGNKEKTKAETGPQSFLSGPQSMAPTQSLIRNPKPTTSQPTASLQGPQSIEQPEKKPTPFLMAKPANAQTMTSTSPFMVKTQVKTKDQGLIRNPDLQKTDPKKIQSEASKTSIVFNSPKLASAFYSPPKTSTMSSTPSGIENIKPQDSSKDYKPNYTLMEKIFAPIGEAASTGWVPKTNKSWDEMSLWEKTKAQVAELPATLFRTEADIGAGIEKSAASFLGALQWVGVDKAKKPADKLDAWAKASMPENPTFADQLASGFGSLITYYIPGLGAMKLTGLIGRYSPAVAAIAGNSVMTFLESAAEAGDTYRESEAKDGRDIAVNKANFVFSSNLILLGITNHLGFFNPEINNAAVRILASMPNEGAQEFLQQVIQNVAAGREDWSAGAYEAGGIGFILGGLAGFGGIDQDSDIPVDLQEKFLNTVQDVLQNQEGFARIPGQSSEQFDINDNLQLSQSSINRVIEDISQKVGIRLGDEAGAADISQAIKDIQFDVQNVDSPGKLYSILKDKIDPLLEVGDISPKAKEAVQTSLRESVSDYFTLLKGTETTNPETQGYERVREAAPGQEGFALLPEEVGDAKQGAPLIIPPLRLDELTDGPELTGEEIDRAGFKDAQGLADSVNTLQFENKPVIAYHFDDNGVLDTFEILPEYRGKGVGTEVLTNFAEENNGQLKLFVPNQDIINTLEKIGTVSVDEKSGYATFTLETPQGKTIQDAESVIKDLEDLLGKTDEGFLKKALEVTSSDIAKIREDIATIKQSKSKETKVEFKNIIQDLSQIATEIKQAKANDEFAGDLQRTLVQRLTAKRFSLTQVARRVARAETRGFKRGRQVGSSETRQAILNAIRNKKQNVADIKKLITEFANQELDLNERGKLLATIKNAQSFKDLLQAEAYIKKLSEESTSRKLRQNIRDELKDIKVKKTKSGIPQTKFGADAYSLLKQIKDNIDADYSVARSKIYDIIAEFESGADMLNLPDDVAAKIELLKMQGIKDMNSEQLQEVLDNIQSLKEEGRMLKELEKFNEETRYIQIREQAIDVITGKKGLKKGSESVPTKEIDKGIFGLARVLDNWQQGWDTLLDKLSKLDKSSKPMQSFLNQFGDVVHYSRQTQNKGVLDLDQKIQEKVREIYKLKGVRLRRRLQNNTKPKKIGVFKNSEGAEVTIELSQNQIYKKYLELQDPTLAETFDEGMHWTQEMKDAVIKAMSPEVKAWADWQLNEFYPSYYQTINDVFRKRYGVDLPFNPQYTPIGRDVDAAIPESVQLAKETQYYASVNAKGLKSRVSNVLPLKFNDGDQVLMRHITEMEHFKAWEQSMKDLRSVFGNKELRTAIRQYHGSNALKMIDNFLNDMARDGSDQALSFGLLDKMRINFTKSVLGINPSIFIKQLTSVWAYATEMPAGAWARGMVAYWKNPIRNYRLLMDSETMKARYDVGFERDIKAAMASDEVKALTGTSNFTNKLLALVKLGDRFAIINGGYPIYRYTFQQERKAGKSTEEAHAEAIRVFERVTKRTQQAGDVEDLGQLQRKGSWGKLFTMFQTSPNQYYRIYSRAIRGLRYGRGSKAANIKNLFIVQAVLPMMFQLVSDGFEFRKDRQLRAIILGPINGILAFGNLIQSALDWTMGSRFSPTTSPAFSTLDDFRKGLLAINDSVKDGNISWEEVGDIVDDLASALGKLTGVPVDPALNIKSGIEDLSTGATSDIRRLIYSPYNLDENPTGGRKSSSGSNIKSLKSLDSLKSLQKINKGGSSNSLRSLNSLRDINKK